MNLFLAAVRCSCSDRPPAISVAAFLPLSTSASRALRLAAPPSRNCSRQPDSVAAVTPSSRERVSRSSPRSSRSTAAYLRFADQRPRPSRRSFGSPSGRPAGSLWGSRSWFSLLAHTHLLVISDSFSSQFGVQENPRAREHHCPNLSLNSQLGSSSNEKL